ncbi:expressed unknown protein [Seminavis robusta]|uniref:Uncharacterized protein n=1 Tax=Seminavis robusta TaxID=568900 RepID=A0A9N8GZP7_9STRA|nr:expressed unknown protein [Seminavis robusta]|eukprot:Sro7_g005690.1 n/a (167) ;mRNA; r:4106-4606
MMQPRSILKVQTQNESLFSALIDESLYSSKLPRSRPQKRVAFDTTEIRTYPRLLDTSHAGLALTIGWEPVATNVTTVQEFYLEQSAPSLGMIVPFHPNARILILLNAGYEIAEILQHVQSVSRTLRTVPVECSKDNERPKPASGWTQKLKKKVARGFSKATGSPAA